MFYLNGKISCEWTEGERGREGEGEGRREGEREGEANPNVEIRKDREFTPGMQIFSYFATVG